MEVNLLSKSGIPDDAILSIRAGSMRRQAQLDSGRDFFRASGEQDIQALLYSQRSPTTPVSSSSDAEVPEVSQPAASTGPQAERPRKKQHQRRVPPATKAPGSIDRQARDKTSRTSSVDRMEMGGALDAVLAQDFVDEQEAIGIGN
eukprot:s1132_g6.t1